MTVSKLSSKRSIWMAVGILMVVIFHTDLLFEKQILNDIKLFFEGGVDVLLFASGMGCYCSFHKNKNVVEFLKRRLIRIMPVFWGFMLFLCWRSFLSLNFVHLAEYFLGNGYNWFITAIWILYLLVPVFYAFIDNSQKPLGKVLFVLTVMLVTCGFWDKYAIMVILARIPVFVVGMIFGKMCVSEESKDKKIPIWAYIVIYLALIVGFVWWKMYNVLETDVMHNIALKWWPFMLSSPGVCLTCSLVATAFDRFSIGRFINIVFSKIGSITFEMFLIHMYMLRYRSQWAVLGERKKWIPWLIEVLIICFAISFADKAIKKLIKKIGKGKNKEIA